MVLWAKTELDQKYKGYNNAKELYEKKIEEQIEIFDKKIEQFKINIEKKQKLIINLKKILDKMENNTRTYEDDIIFKDLFLRCLRILGKDIAMVAGLNAKDVLAEKNISTKINF